MFRALRIGILLLMLATLALGAWRSKQKVTGWKQMLHAVVFPINADGSPASAGQIRRLKESDFDEVESYLQEEVRRYGVALERPLDVHLAPPIEALPPLPPREGGMLAVMAWSLHIKYWAWQNNPWQGPRPDIRLYLLYYDPEQYPSLNHSTGLEKGQMALIQAFAGPRNHRGNLVILTHEMLHTLGASDKYDPASLLPVFPQGYADPQARPRHPQQWAEIMGGRTPISPTEATIPESLGATLIGPATAAEIGLLKPKPRKDSS